MKNLKYMVLGLVLLITESVCAETTIPWTKEGCESVKGKWITAHSATDEGCDAAHCNGLNFCIGRGDNWWSALLWCKAIGHQAADIEIACPNGLASSRTCANLKGITNDVWLATPSDKDASWNWCNGLRSLNRRIAQGVVCTE